ncbi:metal-sensitive transcriptional regulator [Methylobacterium sp. J-030]|uniref:metal-sensitive transcriptional regulator n=1 Tax=Methylobacterium sp. J-030 TaxID=2836627 RepID=UPI001FBA0258|nr:metal-sensitive transcriptional regulator [Methylobacterium sp. J-030]MCJ2071286.1 metal-sensitive transcriptional regulator [Methylobacterium sp. J-030]
MTNGTFVDGRVCLARTEAERAPLVRRLGRIEGQVRGLRAMIEADRYCLDEIQQIRAATAALREVGLLIIGQHLAAGLALATQPDDREAVLEDLQRVLRAAMAEAR